MSEIRRKLIISSLTESKWEEITRFTTVQNNVSCSINTNGYKQLGFFIVAGGGSGCSDGYSFGSTGSGGNGGQARSFEVPVNGSSITITVGAGGARTKNGSNNGSNSSVTYNGQTYQSKGGNRGITSGVPSRQEYSGLGGQSLYTYIDDGEAVDYIAAIIAWATNHIYVETGTYVHQGSTKTLRGSKGENGLPNPFDENDTNLYGAGGAGAIMAYGNPGSTSPILGGNTGGGSGGYGNNNSTTNSGQNASFYGAGGGGGSFSSSHSNNHGGAGYQGIIIIYGKR